MYLLWLSLILLLIFLSYSYSNWRNSPISQLVIACQVLWLLFYKCIMSCRRCFTTEEESRKCGHMAILSAWTRFFDSGYIDFSVSSQVDRMSDALILLGNTYSVFKTRIHKLVNTGYIFIGFLLCLFFIHISDFFVGKLLIVF